MKIENDFVLPEKWCIRGCDELGKFISDDANIEGNYKKVYYYRNNENNLDWSYNRVIKLGYTEITFDQFKEHVLKEIPKPEYEPKDVAFKNDVYSNSEFNGENKILKGYKFKTKELLENFKLIYEGFAPWDDEFDLLPNNILKQRLEKLGVIELWFNPVYETLITLKSGVKLSEDDIAEVKEILNNK